METVVEFEPLTQATLNRIGDVLGPIAAMVVGLADADLSAGSGVIGPREKCLWDREGRRITFTALPEGGLIAGRLNDRDEEFYRAGRFEVVEAWPREPGRKKRGTH